MGVSNILRIWGAGGLGGGQQGFLNWRRWRESPSPTDQKFTHPSPNRKSPSQYTPTMKYFSH